jgi:hypothetical protein
MVKIMFDVINFKDILIWYLYIYFDKFKKCRKILKKESNLRIGFLWKCNEKQEIDEADIERILNFALSSTSRGRPYYTAFFHHFVTILDAKIPSDTDFHIDSKKYFISSYCTLSLEC